MLFLSVSVDVGEVEGLRQNKQEFRRHGEEDTLAPPVNTAPL